MIQENGGTNTYLQSISSILGLIISTGSSLTPIFKSNFVYELFSNTSLAMPSSAIAFVISFLFIWVSSNYKHVNILLFFHERGRGFLEPLIRIDTKLFLVLAAIVSLFLAWFFLFLSQFEEPSFFPYLQSLCYISFFAVLSSSFSILFSNSNEMSRYLEDRRMFSLKIQELAERNGILGKSSEIIENTPLTPQQMSSLGLNIFGAKYIVIKTRSIQPKTIKLIVSHDGEEVIKKI